MEIRRFQRRKSVRRKRRVLPDAIKSVAFSEKKSKKNSYVNRTQDAADFLQLKHIFQQVVCQLIQFSLNLSLD